jgi:1,2-phenylacetyl-CoA epoxidase PaaB subunit
MALKENTETVFVRLPADVKLWIVKQAKKNGSSQNSEIIRSIRDRMDRVAAGQAA